MLLARACASLPPQPASPTRSADVAKAVAARTQRGPGLRRLSPWARSGWFGGWACGGSSPPYICGRPLGKGLARSATVSAPRSPDHQALGAAIRELREERGLSQEELGFRAGLHRNYVGGCERGEINLSFAVMLQLTRGLDVTFVELATRYELARESRQ
jgi:DNA-binding XRE family transcriptional regulator